MTSSGRYGWCTSLASKTASSSSRPRASMKDPKHDVASGSCRARQRRRSSTSPTSRAIGHRSFGFMADSGARPAEAIALEWRHVDLESATVELASKNSRLEFSWRTVHTDESRRRSDPIHATRQYRPERSSTSTVAPCHGPTSHARYGTPRSWLPDSKNERHTTSAQLRAAQPPGRRSHRDTGPPNGTLQRRPHVRHLRRVGSRDGDAAEMPKPFSVGAPIRHPKSWNPASQADNRVPASALLFFFFFSLLSSLSLSLSSSGRSVTG